MVKDSYAKGGLVKVEEPSVKLCFKKEEGSEEGMMEVTGEGVNKFGSFGLVGKYDPETGRMAVSLFALYQTV